MWPQVLPITLLQGGPLPSAPPTLSSSGPCAGWPRLWLPPCSSLLVVGPTQQACLAAVQRGVQQAFAGVTRGALVLTVVLVVLEEISLVAQTAKVSACSAGDPGSIPGSGRSPGEGNGNPLQYSCLGNPMDRGAWWATVRGVAKSRTRLSNFTHSGGTWRLASPEAGKGDSGAAGLPSSRSPGFVPLPRPLSELALLCEQWVAPSCFLAAPLLIGAPLSLFFMGCVAFLPRCSKAGPLLQRPLAGTEPCCFSLRPPCSPVTCPSSGSLGW